MNKLIRAGMSACACMHVLCSNESLYFTGIINLQKVLRVVYSTEILLKAFQNNKMYNIRV